MGSFPRPNEIIETFEDMYATMIRESERCGFQIPRFEDHDFWGHRSYLCLPISIRESHQIIMVRLHISLPQCFPIREIHSFTDYQSHYIYLYNLSRTGAFYTIPTMIIIPKLTSEGGYLVVHIQEPITPPCLCCYPTIVKFETVSLRAYPGGEFELETTRSTLY